MRIWHISDTHMAHSLLPIPEDIDLLIHSGDASNFRDVELNTKEMISFLDWYQGVKAGCKIYVAGNHDTSKERNIIKRKHFSDRGIIYLEDEHFTYNGLKIFGSPCTPEFGIGWAYNRKREKIHKVWDKIEEDTDIIITHGPPYGKLDTSSNYDSTFDVCGDKNLGKQIENRLKKVQLVCFGHIHSSSENDNHGILYRNGVYYSNASVVRDGKLGQIYYTGSLFEVDDNLKISIFK